MPQLNNNTVARSLLAAALLALTISIPASGTPPPGGVDSEPALFGLWRNPTGSVTVKINACGNQVCGTVTAANAEAATDARDAGYPNLEGMTLMRGTLIPRTAAWRGTVLVPDLGRSFSAHIELTDLAHARITGCIWHGLFCRSQTWRRV